MNAKLRATHAVAGFLLLTVAAPVWAQVQNTTNCPQLQDTTKSMLVNRVRARYQAEPAALVQLTDDSLVTGGCYHRLIFDIQSARQSYSLPLYLSPDQRYLTRDLTEVRPVGPVAANAAPGCDGGAPSARKS